MSAQDELYMRRALDAAATARLEGNDPFGAVIVRDGQEVPGRNLSVTSTDVTAHSEVVAIRAATRQWSTLDLGGATLYTSFQPCPMCCGAIVLSGIRTLVIGARRWGARPALGAYRIERLLDMLGLLDSFTIREDVLADEAAAFYSQ